MVAATRNPGQTARATRTTGQAAAPERRAAGGGGPCRPSMASSE